NGKGLTIGNQNDHQGGVLAHVGSVAIYNYSLSSLRINAHYQAGIGSSTNMPTYNGQWVNIVSKNSLRCLDVRDISLAPGAVLQQWACSGGDNQAFQLTWVGSGYKITAKHSNLQLDVAGISSDDGAAIIQWPYWGGANEIWQFTDITGGYYTISASH